MIVNLRITFIKQFYDIFHLAINQIMKERESGRANEKVLN